MNQMKVEFYKLKRTGMMYVAAALYFIMGAALPIKVVNMHMIENLDIYYFFHDSVQDVSLVFLTALFVAWFIGQDFNNRVFQHEIAGGYSRFSIIISRVIPVALASVVMHVIYILGEVITAGFLTGFSFAPFGAADVSWLLTVLVQIVALVLIMSFITFLSGSLFGGITATVIFEFFFCNILRNFLRTGFYTYTCLCFAKDNSPKTLGFCLLSAVITIVVALLATYLVFKKKEI